MVLSKGSGSTYRFSYSSSTLSSRRRPNDVGMGPVNPKVISLVAKLVCIDISTRFVINDQSSGNVPPKKLSERFKKANLTHVVMDFGILPVKKFDLVSKASRLENFPTSGKKPVNPFSERTSCSERIGKSRYLEC